MCDYDGIASIFIESLDCEISDDGVEVSEDRDIAKVLVKIDKMVDRFDLNDIYFVGRCGMKCSEGEKAYKKLTFGDSAVLSFKCKTVNKFFSVYLSVRDYRKRDLFAVKAFSPNITAYLKWMDDVEKAIENFDKLNYTDFENRIRKCFLTLSDKLNDLKFKIIKLKAKKACDKNYRSMLSYIDRLFENRSRLLVVRVDLKYKKNHNDSVRRSMSEYGISGRGIDEFESVKSDMERLLANRRHNKIFDGLLGYVWKLEYGVLTRYHYHVVFFFNSSTKRADKLIGKNIGEYWSNEITQGRGAYFNVNSSSNYYKFDVRGQVHYTDVDAREGLRRIASYFSKADYFMRLELPKRLRGDIKVNYRTMGKGQIQARDSSKGGRPRKLQVM